MEVTLAKIVSTTQINNTYTQKRQNSPAFCKTVHLERHLRQAEIPFERIVNRLSFLLSGTPEHSCERNRHLVDIKFNPGPDADFFIGTISETDSKAYKLRKLD